MRRQARCSRRATGRHLRFQGALWYAKKRDWAKVVERFGEFERQRGRFRPYVEPSAFNGSDDTFVSAAQEVLRLYLWSSDNHPDFEAIRAAFGLPAPDAVKSLLNAPVLRDELDRPRLIMESSDDGRPVRPRGQRFVLENRGKTDAINVVLAPMVLPRRVLTPATIRLLKSGGPAIEVVTDVEFTDRPGPVHEYDRPLGEALSNALRAVEDPGYLDKHGQIQQKVTASYSDHNGAAYEQAFLLRFNWAVQRFEPVEILSPAVRS